MGWKARITGRISFRQPSRGLPLLSLVFLVNVDELDNVADRDRLPVPRKSKPPINCRRFDGDNGAGFTNDDRSRLADVDRGTVGQPDPERLERRVVELAKQIVV